MYTPFDREEASGYRKDNVENRLREGSPVVGISYEGGLLLLTVRRTQRKIYEIYDRQMFSAIGMQADIENVRVRTIQNRASGRVRAQPRRCEFAAARRVRTQPVAETSLW